MTARFKAIAWDVDGTLVDSEPLHYRALIQVCRDLGCRIDGINEKTFLGVSITDVWEQLRCDLPDELQKGDWLAAIDRYYVENCGSIAMQPGALKLIEKAAAAGIRQVCVSNSHRQVVEANLQMMGAERYMEFLVCLDDVKNGKPAPEPYARACSLLELPAHDVLAVEDSRTGAASATAAGLPVAVVGNVNAMESSTYGGFGSLEELAAELFGASAVRELQPATPAGNAHPDAAAICPAGSPSR